VGFFLWARTAPSVARESTLHRKLDSPLHGGVSFGSAESGSRKFKSFCFLVMSANKGYLQI
jgi:hypothetical protein